MNFTTQLATTLLLVTLLSLRTPGQPLAANYRQQSAEALSKVPTVEYCKLWEKPGSYFGKRIRVQAIFRDLISNESVLLDTCGKAQPRVSVQFASDRFEELGLKFGQMNTWGTNEAKVIVIGTFHGPRVPDSEFNYGHMGWSKYLFEIVDLEKIERRAPMY